MGSVNSKPAILTAEVDSQRSHALHNGAAGLLQQCRRNIRDTREQPGNVHPATVGEPRNAQAVEPIEHIRTVMANRCCANNELAIRQASQDAVGSPRPWPIDPAAAGKARQLRRPLHRPAIPHQRPAQR